MRRLISSVVVLIALFVLADRGALAYTEHRVATELKATERLSNTPSVSIHGFPFLTQVVRGKFNDVEVVVSHYKTASVIDIDRIDVHLHDAHVSIGEAFSGGVYDVPVKRVTATVLISYAAMEREHPHLRFAYAGGGDVKVSTPITVAGQTVNAGGTAHLVLNGNNLEVAVDSVTLPGLPSAADAFARRALAVTTRLPALPFKFRLTGVRAAGDGIEISGSANDVTLQRQR